jgi:uncharacterized protein (UPF0264 family)
MALLSASVPRLLVSVRSPEEARAALQGGCDLLDVKEPDRGSLGAADAEVVEAVCEIAGRTSEPKPVSVALGELADWSEGPVPSLDRRVSFAKLGLSGCDQRSDWPLRWRGLRDRFDAAGGGPLDWVAVLYADAEAQGPGPFALIDLAATTGCRGILVDTFSKGRGRLFDHVSPDQLAKWREGAGAAGLMFAVAGSLRAEDLPRLTAFDPDIVAIRGAACQGGRRTAEVCAVAVQRFRNALEAAFGAKAA